MSQVFVHDWRSGLFQVKESGNISAQKARKQLPRNKSFLKCKQHESKVWVNKNDNGIDDCVKFSCVDGFANGKLPSAGEVLSLLITRYLSDLGHNDAILNNTDLDLILHWIFFNFYTQSCTTVTELYDQFT